MNVTPAQPKVDIAKYFLEQLPKDLAKLTELRDELAKRQGAIGAVEAAAADRKQAKEELTAAKTEATKLHKKHAAKDHALDEREKALNTLLANHEAAVKAHDAKVAEQDKALAIRERDAGVKEQQLERIRADLETRALKVEQDEAAVAARLKALQDKVAALGV